MLTFDVGKAGAPIDEATRQKRLKELLEESKPSAAAAPVDGPAPSVVNPTGPSQQPPNPAPAASH